MTRQKATLLLFLILLIGGGFLRDFFMLNINHVLKHLELGYANYAHEFFGFMTDWTVRQIMISKWVLTIIFYLYFWLVSYKVLKAYFGPDQNVSAISYVFMALFVLAGTLYMVGMLFGIKASIYHIVRTLMGLTHSFMPAMVVFLYIKYFPKETTA